MLINSCPQQVVLVNAGLMIRMLAPMPKGMAKAAAAETPAVLGNLSKDQALGGAALLAASLGAPCCAPNIRVVQMMNASLRDLLELMLPPLMALHAVCTIVGVPYIL